MEDKYKILYHYLWTRFRKETAQKAIDAASTEVKEHYDQILEDMAVMEAEVFLMNIVNDYQCDSCGCFLDPERWKVCDKCNKKSTKRNKEHYKEVIKHESGTQDD